MWAWYTRAGIAGLEYETTNNVSESNNRRLKEHFPHLNVRPNEFVKKAVRLLEYCIAQAQRLAVGLDQPRASVTRAASRSIMFFALLSCHYYSQF